MSVCGRFTFKATGCRVTPDNIHEVAGWVKTFPKQGRVVVDADAKSFTMDGTDGFSDLVEIGDFVMLNVREELMVVPESQICEYMELTSTAPFQVTSQRYYISDVSGQRFYQRSEDFPITGEVGKWVGLLEDASYFTDKSFPLPEGGEWRAE